MIPTRRRKRLRHAANWRAASTLSFYRCAIAFGLVAFLSVDAGVDHGLIDPSFAGAFRGLCLFYLALSVGLAGTALVGWPRLDTHIFAQILLDVCVLIGLSYTGEGAAGGAAMLLLAPLAAAGLLLPARQAGLFAALAVLGLLGQETLRHWQLADTPTNFVQSGILGALYFAIAGMACALVRRVRASDASAARHASQARDLAELNHRIIDRMRIGAIVVDSDGRLQTTNQAALNLIGHEPGQAPPQAAAALPPALIDALALWRAGDTAPDIVEIAGRPLQPSFVALGNDNAATLIFIENALRARRQAQQMKLSSLGGLTATIAHQIRNPLGAISHAGQLLAESSTLTDSDARLLDMIHRQARRIDRIVDDVLGLARRSAHRPQTFALDAWLSNAIADYRGHREDPPRLVFAAGPPDTAIRFDPDQLRQVLFNLWDNSDRHARGEQAPIIRIRWHIDQNRNMALDIADDGPGITDDLIHRVLEPFFTTAADGTGLGLHIARELCEANGARLMPITPQTRGACFRIVLPRLSTEPNVSM